MVARIARSRAGELVGAPILRRYVEERLGLRWSPQQISRRLVVEFPDDPTMREFHETIYTSLFVQAEAVLPAELTASCTPAGVSRDGSHR